jgi:hypothetical protein
MPELVDVIPVLSHWDSQAIPVINFIRFIFYQNYMLTNSENTNFSSITGNFDSF